MQGRTADATPPRHGSSPPRGSGRRLRESGDDRDRPQRRTEGSRQAGARSGARAPARPSRRRPGTCRARHRHRARRLRPCDRDRADAKAACRAVVVAALDAHARAWWERLGFHPFHPDDPTETDLYLLTSEIEATLGHTASLPPAERIAVAPAERVGRTADSLAQVSVRGFARSGHGVVVSRLRHQLSVWPESRSDVGSIVVLASATVGVPVPPTTCTSRSSSDPRVPRSVIHATEPRVLTTKSVTACE